jgi:hypothetical protein
MEDSSQKMGAAQFNITAEMANVDEKSIRRKTQSYEWSNLKITMPFWSAKQAKLRSVLDWRIAILPAGRLVLGELEFSDFQPMR